MIDKNRGSMIPSAALVQYALVDWGSRYGSAERKLVLVSTPGT